jgi:hypothetical protein
VACLIEAHPDWSVDKMRAQLFYTADYYLANRTHEPTYVRGYGILDTYGALVFIDCNINGIPDAEDMDECDGSPWCSDCNHNDVLDECDIAEDPSLDMNGNGIPDVCETDKHTIPANPGPSGGPLPDMEFPPEPGPIDTITIPADPGPPSEPLAGQEIEPAP